MRWPWQPKDPNRTERTTPTPPPAPPTPGVLSTWDPVPDPPMPEVDPVPVREPGAPWESRRVTATGLTVWTRPLDENQPWAEVVAEARSYGCHAVLVDEAFWEAVQDWEAVDEPAPGPAAADDDLDGAAWLRRSRDHHADDEIPVPLGEGEVMARISEAPETPRLCRNLMINVEDTVLLVPVAAAWQIPGALSWDGATNQGLDGADHARILRRWAGLYGAQLVALGRDTVTLLVERPPTADTFATTCEWFLYCEDVVLQGPGTFAGLDEAVRRPVWEFWWD